MKTIPLSEVKSKLSKIIDNVYKIDEEIVITRNGRPVAVMISPDEFEGWKDTIAVKSDEEFINDIRKSLKGFSKKSKIYSLQELFNDE